MKALMPYTFRTGGIVDAEAINGNLRAASADVGRNLSKRYTYSQCIVPITGIANTDTQNQRTVFHRNPIMSLVAVEAVIYSASGATWTISVDNGSTSDSFTVATLGATTKATGGLSRLFAASQAGNFSDPLWSPTLVQGNRFLLSCSTGSTITSGYLVLHYRGDRAFGSDHSGYTPTLLQATTSSAGSVLDTQLSNFASAVTRDSTNATDLRVECFVARNFSTVQTWVVPNGADRSALPSTIAVLGAAGRSVTFFATSASRSVAANGTGFVFDTLTASDAADDPTNSANDTLVTFTPVGGSIDLAYMFLVWR